MSGLGVTADTAAESKLEAVRACIDGLNDAVESSQVVESFKLGWRGFRGEFHTFRGALLNAWSWSGPDGSSSAQIADYGKRCAQWEDWYNELAAAPGTYPEEGEPEIGPATSPASALKQAAPWLIAGGLALYLILRK